MSRFLSHTACLKLTSIVTLRLTTGAGEIIYDIGLQCRAASHLSCLTSAEKRSDGGWLAAVLMPAASSNGKSRLTVPLLLDPQLITTDLSVVKPYEETEPDNRELD